MVMVRRKAYPFGHPPKPVVTVKFTPLLATPETVTTTFPLLAPAGTAATMVVEFQLVGIAATVLNVTLPGAAPKFMPVIVTEVPTGPELGDKPVIVGAGRVGVTET